MSVAQLEHHPLTEGLLWIQFQDRAHAWVAGFILVWAHTRGSQLILLSYIDVSLLSLPVSLKAMKKCPWVRIKNKTLRTVTL